MPGYLIKSANFVAEIGNDDELVHLAEVETIQKDTKVRILPGKEWIEAKKVPILRKVWGLDVPIAEVPPPINRVTQLGVGSASSPVPPPPSVPPVASMLPVASVASVPPPSPAKPPRLGTVVDYNPLMHSADYGCTSHDDTVPQDIALIRGDAQTAGFQSIASDIMVAVDSEDNESLDMHAIAQAAESSMIFEIRDLSEDASPSDSVQNLDDIVLEPDAAQDVRQDSEIHADEAPPPAYEACASPIEVFNATEPVADDGHGFVAGQDCDVETADVARETLDTSLEHLSSKESSSDTQKGRFNTPDDAECPPETQPSETQPVSDGALQKRSQELFEKMGRLAEDEYIEVAPDEVTYVMESRRIEEDHRQCEEEAPRQGLHTHTPAIEASSIEVAIGEDPSPRREDSSPQSPCSPEEKAHHASDALNGASPENADFQPDAVSSPSRVRMHKTPGRSEKRRSHSLDGAILGDPEDLNLHGHSSPVIASREARSAVPETGELTNLEEIRAARAAIRAAEAVAQKERLDSLILKRAAQLVDALEAYHQKTLKNAQFPDEEGQTRISPRAKPREDEDHSDILKVRKRAELDRMFADARKEVCAEDSIDETTTHRHTISNRRLDEDEHSDILKVRKRSELRRLFEGEKDELVDSSNRDLRGIFEKQDELHLFLANAVREKESEVEHATGNAPSESSRDGSGMASGEGAPSTGTSGETRETCDETLQSLTNARPVNHERAVVRVSKAASENTAIIANPVSSSKHDTLSDAFFAEKLMAGEKRLNHLGSLYLTNMRIWNVHDMGTSHEHYEAFDVGRISGITRKPQTNWWLLAPYILVIVGIAVAFLFKMYVIILACALYAVVMFLVCHHFFFRTIIQIDVGPTSIKSRPLSGRERANIDAFIHNVMAVSSENKT